MGILVTMNSHEGLEMFKLINPKIAIPIHYYDYDVFKSPIEDFLEEINSSDLKERICFLRHGEEYIFKLDNH